MNFNIFKTKQKSPHDLVKHVKDAILKLDSADKRKVNNRSCDILCDRTAVCMHINDSVCMYMYLYCIIGYRRDI
ncbi:hypothetical protein BDB01DRAFT_770919 [Pilobolus umbonatus]|nr:hypothetical protein BDB01DRAFT_770919 [Pilobolus umbonatus]